MPIPIITSDTIPGESGVGLYARIRGADGSLMTQASINSISYTVTDLTPLAGPTQIATGTLTVASVIFDSLQQSDLSWTADSAGRPGVDGAWGYNFLAVLDSTNFVPSGDTFQADLRFTAASGQAFVVSFLVPTAKVYA